MKDTLVFATEILASLALSALIVYRLQELLRRIGAQACERGAGNTEFWLGFMQLMMFIAPLILVSWQSDAGKGLGDLAQLKSSITIVLVGQFIGLALIGRAVWKTVFAPPQKPPAAAAPAPVTA